MSHVAVPVLSGVDTGEPDFTRRPNPDGSHASAILGNRPDTGTDELPERLAALLARPPAKAGVDNGPRWQRNPNQEPIDRPLVRRRRKQSPQAVDEAVRAGMAEIISASTPTVTVTRTGRRMLVVDKAFYTADVNPNYRPQPVRKGAGKGPRSHHFHHRPRC